MKPITQLLLTFLFVAVPSFGDTLEFSNGAVLNGTITKIDDQKQVVSIRAKIGGRTHIRRYPFSSLRSITHNGQKRGLGKPAASPSASGSTTAGKNTPAEQQIRQLIASTGPTYPSWCNSTRINYPRSLGISWPRLPPNTQWNQRNYIVHYLYSDIIPS